MAVDILSRHSQEFKVIIDADKRPSGEHERRFNVPLCNEVGILMLGEEHGKRDIVLRHNDESLQRVDETHRSYNPFQYPLLFPRGKDGRCFGYKSKNGQKVSSIKLYAFRLMIRPSPDFNTLHRFQKLMQQFVVDMYVNVETERLQFVRSCQKELHAESYAEFIDVLLQGWIDSRHSIQYAQLLKIHSFLDDANPVNIGQKVILPSSFVGGGGGGARYMHERTQDAMPYVCKLGRPSLFVTMTCNPLWPEITNEFFYGQLPHHCPEIVVQVFHVKQRALMAQITNCRIFGDVIAYVCSIEWQKRGLPCAHILIWLAAKNKIHANLIDFVISAQIPEKETNPQLHKIVMANMIHGPCGRLNNNSPCMVDNYCSKHFPKNFCRETQCSNDGYQLYRHHSPDEGGYTGVNKLKARSIRSTTVG